MSFQRERMERWQRVQKPPAPRRGYDCPSFSSTLLDSICRSFDDETLGRGPEPTPAPARKKQQQQRPADHLWAPPPPPLARTSKPPRGGAAPAVARPQQPLRCSTTTSSSSDSSYGGFSSSEPESGPARPNRLKPIRTAPSPIPQPPPEKKNKKNLASIKNKFRELRKSRSPTSPAARLASFLNSLFTPSTPSGVAAGRKQRTAACEESACSTASSNSRSCLVKTPSLSAASTDRSAKRSVRFALPVDGGNGWLESRKAMAWRDLNMEGEDDDDAASDASSDLFELENLTAAGRYRDELPVYETTHLTRLIL